MPLLIPLLLPQFPPHTPAPSPPVLRVPSEGGQEAASRPLLAGTPLAAGGGEGGGLPPPQDGVQEDEEVPGQVQVEEGHQGGQDDGQGQEQLQGDS